MKNKYRIIKIFTTYNNSTAYSIEKRFLLFFWKTVQAFESYTRTYHCGYLVETDEIKKIKQEAINYMKHCPEKIRLEKFEKQIAKKQFQEWSKPQTIILDKNKKDKSQEGRLSICNDK